VSSEVITPRPIRVTELPPSTQPAIARRPPVPSSAVASRPPIQPIRTPAEDFSDAQIGASIQKGVNWLFAQMDPRTHMLQSIFDDQLGITKGQDILAVYALMQCGEAIDDPRLKKTGREMRELIAAMKSIPLANYGYETYARGLRATALSLYNRPEDKLMLQADTEALVSGCRAGGYSYSLTHRAALRGILGNWDNSNSQYGLLGVWSAAEAGIEVPQQYWNLVNRHWNTTQCRNGQWAYLEPDRGGTYTMTCAGIASLFVCYDYLSGARFAGDPGRPPFTRGISMGLRWLETGDNCIPQAKTHHGYALYGLERVALASGFKYFGSHDWYRELARQTISTQQADGSWDGGTVETAYNLLFLSRGRHPILMNKLRFDGYWANRPRDIANLTRFTSHQLERQINWQVVPLERPWTDWMDSPILYLASHRKVNLSEADVTKIRSFVENGGLLFTQADGDSEEFNTFAADLAHRLFPAYEFQPLPANHPLCTSMFKVKPDAAFKIVTNGSRILMLHSTVDLARYWQIRDNKRTPIPFELGTNLFVYAAGRQEFRNRLVSTYIPKPTQKPTRTSRIARLSYAGNWDPEPAAWQRFARWFQNQTGYGLEIVNIPISQLKAETAPVADLTGTARYELTSDEAEAVKKYVQSGGVLLIDTCGGTGAFDQGLQSSLYFKAFPNASPVSIYPSHPLLSADRAGMDDLSHPRLRPFATDILGRHARLPDEIAFGRGRVILTSLDLTTGLLGTDTWGILGYDPAYAQALVKNTILWTLDGQHDEYPTAGAE